MNGPYTTVEVLRILGVTEQELRACLRAALYPPTSAKQSRFSFQDLILLRTAKDLCRAGISVRRIRRILTSLKSQLPPEQQLSTVKIYADGRRVVVWDTLGRWQPDSGQFLLNFDAGDIIGGAPRVKTLKTRGGAHAAGAQQWLDRGMYLEESSPDEACQAYREALRLDPSLVDAHINLGFLLHRDGRLPEAEQCYRAAIAYAPAEILGYFNLAVVLEDQGDRKGAIEAYEAVIARRPYFMDAHHHVALLYEAEGRRADAIRHYSMARKLSLGEKKSTTRKRSGGNSPNPFHPV